MQRTTDVVIVGGGIIGCAIAYFLQKRGINVTVLEETAIGKQSSSAAVGLLAPIRPLSSQSDPFKALQLASLARFRSLIPELEALSGIETRYEQTGALRVLPVEKIEPVRTWSDEWNQMGFHCELLSPEETYRREPLLFPGLAGALFIAEEAQVSPAHLVKAYAQGARELGAAFFEHAKVVAFQQSGDRITGVSTNKGDVFLCHQLILATGVWSAECGKQLGISFPVRPVRGEVLAVQQPSTPIRHIFFDEGVFDEDICLAPKPDNTIWISGTKKDVGMDTSVSVGGVLHLLTILSRLFPALVDCRIQRMWAGLRPKTPENRPLIGPAPQWANVTLASGHGAFGILLSAITGELVAECIETGDLPEMLRPFAPKEPVSE